MLERQYEENAQASELGAVDDDASQDRLAQGQGSKDSLETQIMKRSQWKIRTNLDSSKRADYSEVCSICCQTSTLLSICDANMSASDSRFKAIEKAENASGEEEGKERSRASGNSESSIPGLTTPAASLREFANAKSASEPVANPKADGLSDTSTSSAPTTMLAGASAYVSSWLEGEENEKVKTEGGCTRIIDGKGPLISACLCLGRRQHKSCIEDWLEQTGATSCPFCLVRYELRRERKSFWSYMREDELEHELVVSLLSLSLASYLLLLALAVCRQQLMMKQVQQQADDSSTWSVAFSMLLFCFVCISTVLLFIATVSIGLNVVFRHYVRYSLWCKSHYKVHIEPYKLGA